MSAGSLMRATPPSRRMSAGTRSRAMTATAPASSATLACPASTTSMITPPRSISARPRLTVPVMAKARIGHFAEAQVLAALGVDYIDESEVLTPADEAHHIDKWAYTVPFVCGATK